MTAVRYLQTTGIERNKHRLGGRLPIFRNIRRHGNVRQRLFGKSVFPLFLGHSGATLVLAFAFTFTFAFAVTFTFTADVGGLRQRYARGAVVIHLKVHLPNALAIRFGHFRHGKFAVRDLYRCVHRIRDRLVVLIEAFFGFGIHIRFFVLVVCNSCVAFFQIAHLAQDSLQRILVVLYGGTFPHLLLGIERIAIRHVALLADVRIHRFGLSVVFAGDRQLRFVAVEFGHRFHALAVFILRHFHARFHRHIGHFAHVERRRPLLGRHLFALYLGRIGRAVLAALVVAAARHQAARQHERQQRNQQTSCLFHTYTPLSNMII